jgi:hypothetical protein
MIFLRRLWKILSLIISSGSWTYVSTFFGQKPSNAAATQGRNVVNDSDLRRDMSTLRTHFTFRVATLPPRPPNPPPPPPAAIARTLTHGRPPRAFQPRPPLPIYAHIMLACPRTLPTGFTRADGRKRHDAKAEATSAQTAGATTI